MFTKPGLEKNYTEKIQYEPSHGQFLQDTQLLPFRISEKTMRESLLNLACDSTKKVEEPEVFGLLNDNDLRLSTQCSTLFSLWQGQEYQQVLNTFRVMDTEYQGKTPYQLTFIKALTMASLPETTDCVTYNIARQSAGKLMADCARDASEREFTQMQKTNPGLYPTYEEFIAEYENKITLSLLEQKQHRRLSQKSREFNFRRDLYLFAACSLFDPVLKGIAPMLRDAALNHPFDMEFRYAPVEKENKTV